MEEDLKKIIEHYGVKPQVRKFNEESYELEEAILDYINVEVYKGSAAEVYYKEHLIEELADVEVMLGEFIEHYNIDRTDIDKVKQKKIERQLKRIESDGHR